MKLKLSAYYWNAGAFLKCWHTFEMLAYYWNVGASLKCWHTIEMSALYWNVGALLKCWRFIVMSVHYWNVGVLLKNRRPVQRDMYKYNSWTVWPSKTLQWLLLLCTRWWLSLSLSPPEGVGPSPWMLMRNADPDPVLNPGVWWPKILKI